VVLDLSGALVLFALEHLFAFDEYQHLSLQDVVEEIGLISLAEYDLALAKEAVF